MSVATPTNDSLRRPSHTSMSTLEVIQQEIELMDKIKLLHRNAARQKYVGRNNKWYQSVEAEAKQPKTVAFGTSESRRLNAFAD